MGHSPDTSRPREPKEYFKEELSDLRFDSAEQAKQFLIDRGILNQTFAIIEGDTVRDSRSNPGWTLTELDHASRKIKISQMFLDLSKSTEGKTTKELLQMAKNMNQGLPPETVVITPPEGPAEA